MVHVGMGILQYYCNKYPGGGGPLCAGMLQYVYNKYWSGIHIL